MGSISGVRKTEVGITNYIFNSVSVLLDFCFGNWYCGFCPVYFLLYWDSGCKPLFLGAIGYLLDKSVVVFLCMNLGMGSAILIATIPL